MFLEILNYIDLKNLMFLKISKKSCIEKDYVVRDFEYILIRGR